MTVVTTNGPLTTRSFGITIELPVARARPIAHPFTHEPTTTRCPACELRQYLES
jgi:hypothetical protein